MTSPFTATSRVGREDWRRIIGTCPSILAAALERGGRRAHLFAESSRRVRRRMRQGVVGGTLRPPSFSRAERFLEGCSVCVDRGQDCGFAARATFAPREIMNVLEEATAGIGGGHEGYRSSQARAVPDRPLPWTVKEEAPEIRSPMLAEARAHEFLRRLGEYCFGLEPRLRSVDVMIDQVGRRRLVGMAGETAGRIHTDHRLRTSVVLYCKAARGEVRLVRGTSDRCDEWLESAAENLAVEAARRLASTAAMRPEGVWQAPVIFEAGWCAGTWVHELIGHQLEADNVERGWSVFGDGKGRIDGLPLTVEDRPGEEALSGYMEVDDEATPASGTMLLKEGQAVGLLHDRRTAERFGVRPTGSGRRQDYRFPPQPRMSNLVVAPGVHTSRQLSTACPRLVHVHAISHGHLDARSGKFHFEVDYAELLERGEPAGSLSELIVEGNVRDALRAIAMTGEDIASDEGRGRCVKNGQVVDIGTLAPSILIEELTIRRQTG